MAVMTKEGVEMFVMTKEGAEMTIRGVQTF
jgi:hypothetical protein